MTSLGSVLEEFPDEVITYITDPRTGIQRRSKWPPTISEVLTACEEHQEFIAKRRAFRPIVHDRLPALRLKDRPAGCLAQVFVPEGHARYDAIVKWSESAEPQWWKFGKSSEGHQGIWVSHDAWGNRTKS